MGSEYTSKIPPPSQLHHHYTTPTLRSIDMPASLGAALLVVLLTGALLGPVLPQNCGCGSDLCCSRFGYCGKTEDYCGDGCRAGPCRSSEGEVSVSDVVTADFFDGILNHAGEQCPGRSFYTRAAFLDAVNSYPTFGQGGSAVLSMREIAAFFAHVTFETEHFCYIEEVNGASVNYCVESKEYPCAAGKRYYGRGPLQLSYNFNYGRAGESIGFDGLKNPEIVANDSVVSFKTALWFWMESVHPVVEQGFGATIKAINVKECDGGNNQAAKARVSYYQDYCALFGVSSSDFNYNQVHIF